MRLFLVVIFCSTFKCLCGQDSALWVKEINQGEKTGFNNFRTKNLFADQDSNLYLFGKSKGVSIQNDTIQTPNSLFNITHYMTQFSSSGEINYLTDENLLWVRSWIEQDELGSFHCIHQRPGDERNSPHEYKDLVYNKFDNSFNLLDEISLVRAGGGGAYSLSHEVLDNQLYVAFSVGTLDENGNAEIGDKLIPVLRDDITGVQSIVVIIKYDLSTNQLIWSVPIYTDIFRYFEIKVTKSGEVYFATSYEGFIAVNDEERIESTNRCGNCPQMFISKFDSLGNKSWDIINDDFINIGDLMVVNEDLIVAGSYLGDIRFDDILLRGSDSRIFLLKITSEGVYDIAKRISFARSESAPLLEEISENVIMLSGRYVGLGISDIGDTLKTGHILGDNAFLHFMDQDFESIKTVGIYGESSGSLTVITDALYHNGTIAITGSQRVPSIILNQRVDNPSVDIVNGFLGVLDIDLNLDGVTVSTDDLGDAQQFKIYPNPSSHLIIIESEEALRYYEVRNSLGHLLYRGRENTVDISQLTSGSYYISINGNSTASFIKL